MNLIRDARVMGTLALTLGLTVPIPARATQGGPPQQYDVEILVFANNNPDDQGEQWPAHPGMPDVNAAAQLGTPGGPELLPSRDYRLSGVAADLERSGRYRPILHLEWRQTATPLRKPGPGVHVEGPGGDNTVDGTVTLSAGNYLHLNIDLVYRPASAAATGGTTPSAATPTVVSTPAQEGSSAGPSNAPPGNTATPPTPQAVENATASPQQPSATTAWVSNPGVFRMDQHRRLHKGKMEYFDQPYFGVLALVTPYTPPPAADTKTTSDAGGSGTAAPGSAPPQGGQ